MRSLRGQLKIPLFCLAATALFMMIVACTDDDDVDRSVSVSPPGVDVSGVWEGEFSSDRTEREGAICLDLSQDMRQVEGVIAAEDDGLTLSVSGAILEENGNLSLVWGPGAPGSPTPDLGFSYDFADGGTFIAEPTDDELSGTWASLDLDMGSWTATRSDSESCPSA